MHAIDLPKAVLQPSAHPDRSQRYAHVNSREVVKALEGEGYTVHGVSVTATRNKNRDPLYARHQVLLRHPDLRQIEGITPQIIFVNSHDGTSSAEIRQGMWRQVCSNGLVSWMTTDMMRVRHSGAAAQKVLEKVQSLARATQPLFDKIERWAQIELNKAQRAQFARLGAMIRWGDPARFPVEALLAPRRAEDDSGSLWAVFNRVQENAVRGGMLGLSRSGRSATARPLSEINANNNFNADLWRLAEDFAEAM